MVTTVSMIQFININQDLLVINVVFLFIYFLIFKIQFYITLPILLVMLMIFLQIKMRLMNFLIELKSCGSNTSVNVMSKAITTNLNYHTSELNICPKVQLL